MDVHNITFRTQFQIIYFLFYHFLNSFIMKSDISFIQKNVVNIFSLVSVKAAVPNPWELYAREGKEIVVATAKLRISATFRI